MRGLCAGSEYELRSELHLRGESGEDEGAVASASLAFVAEGPEASRAVELGVDASRFAGKTLVAFEELYRDGKRVGSHADISDEAQSVCVPAIRTALTAPGGEKTVSVGQAGSAVELTDTVEYTGLVPGKAYRLEGTLHARSGDRADAGALLDREGKPVEASAEFVAEASSGSCSVSFSVDASALAGRSAVAFERLLAGDVQLASHEDIGDEAQTVSFEEGPGTPGTPAATPQTGDKALPFFACAVLGGLLAFCAASIHHASRLREKDR